MILGIGTDILKINRIEVLLLKYKELFIKRILHPKEYEKYNLLPSNKKISFIAKRFSAKEAISKALGTGIRDIAFKDIIILNDALGKPYVEFDTEEGKMKPCQIDLSLSDDYPFVVAFVIISKKIIT